MIKIKQPVRMCACLVKTVSADLLSSPWVSLQVSNTDRKQSLKSDHKYPRPKAQVHDFTLLYFKSVALDGYH